jgi:hypothetical protein
MDMDIAQKINEARNHSEAAEYSIDEMHNWITQYHYDDNGDHLYSVETQRCDDLIEQASVLIARVNNLLHDAAEINRKAGLPFSS